MIKQAASSLRHLRRQRPQHFLSTASFSQSSNVPGAPPINATSGSIGSKWDDMLRRFAGYYGEESTAIRHSHTVFRSCHEVGTQEHMLPHLILEDNFFHKHALINLHVWMIHNRLRCIGAEGKVTQEQLYDRFWEDTTERIRILGVPELTVNKHLKETQTFSFGAAMAYDQGLNTSKDELAGAIYRNIFQSPVEERNGLEQSIFEVADYIQDQVAHLAKQSDDDVLIGKISWSSSPGGKKIKDSTYKSEEWKEAISDTGDVYYWNPRTRETRWKK